MRCRDVLARTWLALDSELDADTARAVDAHLRSCASCARRFRSERRLEREIARRLARTRPGDEALFARALRRATGMERGDAR